MTRTPLGQVACSIARATDLFGDAWTALIMRDVITGVTRFDDLARDLGISRKVLAARLARLVEEGVLTRERYQDHPPREHYRATAKGRSCTRSCWPSWRGATAGTPVPEGPPARIRHLDCGNDTTAVPSCAHCGGTLTPSNTTQLPGPGGRVGPGTQVLGPLLAERA